MANTEHRLLLQKSKLYRTFSLVFVTLGIFVFCFMYVNNVDGRLMDALKDPTTIGIFLIPFLPAAALSFIADRYEKKYIAATQQQKKT